VVIEYEVAAQAGDNQSEARAELDSISRRIGDLERMMRAELLQAVRTGAQGNRKKDAPDQTDGADAGR
jgi:hypothetical protein